VWMIFFCLASRSGDNGASTVRSIIDASPVTKIGCFSAVLPGELDPYYGLSISFGSACPFRPMVSAGVAIFGCAAGRDEGSVEMNPEKAGLDGALNRIAGDGDGDGEWWLGASKYPHRFQSSNPIART